MPFTSRTVKVVGMRHLNESSFSLVIEKNEFTFIPGQCVNLGLPGNAVNREYSLYSGVNEDILEFLIKTVEGGTVSPLLHKLKEGDLVDIDGPYGEFILKETRPAGEYVFVGSGTGISPFRSFVRSFPEINYKIIHGIRTKEEMYDRDEYEAGRYVSCTSRDETGEYKGRVTGYLQENPQSKDAKYYLCGNRGMINDVYDILRDQGVSGSNIITEVFF